MLNDVYLRCSILMMLGAANHALANVAADTRSIMGNQSKEAIVSQPSSVLSPIIVTANRFQQRQQDTLSGTTVLTRKDIQQTTAIDLPSLLQTVAGIQVINSGPPGSPSSVFVRGANANQTLVLVDGVRVDSASLGQASLSTIPLSMVDKIEITRGAASSMYGSGAMGGVIQIFTHSSTQKHHFPYGSLSAEYGKDQTQRQQVDVGGQLDQKGRTYISFSADRFKTNGFPTFNAAQAPLANPAQNGYFSQSAQLALQQRIIKDWTIGLSYFQVNTKGTYASAFGPPTDEYSAFNRLQTFSWSLDGHIRSWWKTHFQITQNKNWNENQKNNLNTHFFNTTNHQFTWQNDLDLPAKQHLQWGAEYLTQSLESDVYSTPNRQVRSVWLTYLGERGKGDWQANFRYDDYSNFGAAKSYLLAYGWKIHSDWKLIGSIASAFKAPSFNDLYYPGFGNIALKPERSKTFELAMQYDALGVMRLSAFYTYYDDLIEYRLIHPMISRAQNIGSAKVQGLEWDWQASLDNTHLRTNLTIQRPINEDNGEILQRRARRLASFVLTQNWHPWSATFEWQGVGPTIDMGHALGGYGIVNLGISYQITKQWYANFMINNMFNKQYQQLYSYNTPGRGVYLKLAWQF